MSSSSLTRSRLFLNGTGGIPARRAAAASSASGVTTMAASASETPRRCRQSREGAGGGIAEGAQGGQQRGQEDMHPLIGFPLHHTEQTSLEHPKGRGLKSR